IRTLISILFDSAKDKELLEFSKKNRLTLRLLEHAYIASRYLFDRFDKDDAEEAIKVAEKVFNVVQKLFENINETG
ncbi:MAG: HEPN domain-containing protein, partial [Candidatus Baldrarchaeota archaeon]